MIALMIAHLVMIGPKYKCKLHIGRLQVVTIQYGPYCIHIWTLMKFALLFGPYRSQVCTHMRTIPIYIGLVWGDAFEIFLYRNEMEKKPGSWGCWFFFWGSMSEIFIFSDRFKATKFFAEAVNDLVVGFEVIERWPTSLATINIVANQFQLLDYTEVVWIMLNQQFQHVFDV